MSLRKSGAVIDPAGEPAGHCRAYAAPRELTLRAYLTSWTGYGGIARHLGRGLEANGLGHFRFHDVHTDPRYLGQDPWVAARTRPDRPSPGTPVVQLAVPRTRVPRNNPTVVVTMWESSRLAPAHAAELNRALAVVVPCAWNRDGFAASGVTVPLHVVPLGVDPGVFHPRPSPAGRPFTVGMSGRMESGAARKGLNEGMGAFAAAFPGREDVRLDVKVFEDCVPALRVPADPRIVVNAEAYTPDRMAAWFAGLDCLFVPSKSEGWGLNTLEAMAVGRPVIAADYAGTREFWTPACGWELPYAEEPAGEFYTGLGDWCVPTVAGMVRALRAASAASRDEVEAKGRAASASAARFPWTRTGRELVDVLRGVEGFLPR